jgi:hypothetical protein
MRRDVSQRGKVLVAILCVLLAVFMTVEISHSHGTNMDPMQCQFCATAHVALASQPSWLSSYVLHLIRIVAIGEPSLGSQPVVSTAFIRPPPVPAAFLA